VTGEDDESVSSEGSVEENDAKIAANPAESLKDDDEYKGVKKEHLVIIPGVEKTDEKKKKKKKKNKRVPCRARGMPMAHNFKTSYFIIPDNIQHGDELECSFPACRSAGAKFRYCLHCKVPVAKRNFRNRHKHGNMGDKKRSPPSASNEAGSVPALPAVEGICLPVTDAKESVKEEEKNTPEVEGEGDLKPSSLPQPDSAVAAPKNEEEAANSVSVSTGEDATKVQSWVSLLENKPDPDDKEAMTEWMMKVMNASGGGAAAAAAAPVASVATSESNEPPKKKFKDGSED
jgi:hypothetical protein